MSRLIYGLVFVILLVLAGCAKAELRCGDFLAQLSDKPDSVEFLGSVRKVLPQASQRASQRDHCGKTLGELVVTGANSPVLFEPAKHPLDDVPLPVFRTIKQSG